MPKQYMQQRMQPFARWALMPLNRLHLAPLHDEQEVLSDLRNSSPLSHLSSCLLGSRSYATGCTLLGVGCVGFWWVLGCFGLCVVVQPV